jgi:hypothetical protein
MLLLRKILYCLVLIAILMTAGITEVGLTQEYDANAVPFSSASDVFVYSSSGSYYVAPTGNDSNIGAYGNTIEASKKETVWIGIWMAGAGHIAISDCDVQ